ncbi:MAG: hypothetical protein M3450_04200 [Actinomycetota bacterium]|nr:hypothetical protein [Actinomycetota bacterium]
MLVDLADECATPDDRAVIEAPRKPTFGKALAILGHWGVLEPEAADHFEVLRRLRNALIHFDPNLYETLRASSLEAVSTLRDAIDSQFGVFVQRRLIPNTPGVMFLKRAVEEEPFVRRYVLPLALHVGPLHTLEFHAPPGYWAIASDPPVEGETHTDEEFVKLMGSSLP